jgi:hypothetical protein
LEITEVKIRQRARKESDIVNTTEEAGSGGPPPKPNFDTLREICIRSTEALDGLVRFLSSDRGALTSWQNFDREIGTGLLPSASYLKDRATILGGFGLHAEDLPHSKVRDKVIEDAKSSVRELWHYAKLIEGST